MSWLRRLIGLTAPLVGAVAGTLLWLSAPGTAGAVEAVVTDLRVGLNKGVTRIVIDLSKQIPVRVFSLADPYRIVVDMPEVGWQLPGRPLPGDVGLLKQFRYGRFKPGMSRLVIDARGAAAVSQAFLIRAAATAGYRFVLDLAATDRDSFLAAVARPAMLIVRAAQVRRPAEAPPQPGKQAAAPKPAQIKLDQAKPDQAKPAQPDTAKPTAPRQTAALPTPRRKPRQQALAPVRKRVVVLDPGHGGIDPGTIGRSGVYEKHVVFATAREMHRQLTESGRYRVVMTRGRDQFVRLRDRVEKAREAEGDLFISLHADSIQDQSIRGLSVYTLSERASDAEAGRLAEKENKADLIAGIDLGAESPEVQNILIDLAQRETMNASARFAATLIEKFSRETELLRKTHRFAGFAVLKAPDVPSVLVEIGFLSNRADEKALRSKDYRGRLARALLSAVDDYFNRVEQANR